MRRVCACFAVCLFLLALFSLPCAALEEGEVLDDLLAALPPTVSAALGELTSSEGAATLVGAEYLPALAIDSLRGELRGSVQHLSRLLGIALLLAALARLRDALGDGAATRAAECGIGVILILLLYRLTEADMTRATATVQDMHRFANGLLPIFVSLFAAGGSTGTATAAAGGFTALAYLLQQVVAGALLPLLRVLLGFVMMTAVWRQGSLTGIYQALRQLYVTLLGFLSALLVASLAFQSTLAASADSLAAHSVRFAIGNLIPVVGGALGGTLRTLSATLSLLKNTVGAVAVAALLLLLLPTLIGLLLHRLLLSLAAAISTALGSETAGKILTDFRAIYDLAAATLAIGAVVFILIIGVLARIGLAIG